MNSAVELLVRILNGIMNAWNKHKVKDATDNPADTLADGGKLHKSDRTFTDISNGVKRD